MAVWSVKPIWKKSIVERIHFEKGDETIIVETGWRWGEFTVVTEDDTPPHLEPGVDIYDCDYEAELVECSDGCWEEHILDDCSDETKEWFEQFIEDGNSYFELESHGWISQETEMIIDCDMEIEKIED
jgi:hypothetical protein